MTNQTWCICSWCEKYNCSALELLFLGTREEAEAKAAELGDGYFVKDGRATADAFKGDNT